MTFTNIHNGGGDRDERKEADGYLEPPPVIAALAACFGGPTTGRVSGDRFLIDWGRQRAWPVLLGGCRRSLVVGGSADPRLNGLPVPECFRATVVVAICSRPICVAPRAGGRPPPALEPVSIGRAAVVAASCPWPCGGVARLLDDRASGRSMSSGPSKLLSALSSRMTRAGWFSVVFTLTTPLVVYAAQSRPLFKAFLRKWEDDLGI